MITVEKAKTWLAFRSELEANIRIAPDDAWLDDLGKKNKDRFDGGPENQKASIKQLVAARRAALKNG